MSQKDLVDHMEKFQGKVMIGNDSQSLYNQISKLSGNVGWPLEITPQSE